MTAEQLEPTAATAEIADLQDEVSATLTDLDVLADLVHALLDTRQRGLGFLTPEAKRAQDQMMRTERAARGVQTRRADGTELEVGLDWMRGTPATYGTGHINTAGNPTAISVAADIGFTLAHLTRRVVRALDRAGFCPLHQLPGNPTTSDQVAHLRALILDVPSTSLLTEVLSELEQLVDDATFVVDGNDRAQLGDCPHCGTRTANTLVVYFKTGIIRCDRDPRSGHYAPCWCADPFCPCVNTPTTFRHEWQRAHPTRADGWYALADRMKKNRPNEGAHQ